MSDDLTAPPQWTEEHIRERHARAERQRARFARQWRKRMQDPAFRRNLRRRVKRAHAAMRAEFAAAFPGAIQIRLDPGTRMRFRNGQFVGYTER